MPTISERLQLANQNENLQAIIRLKSGWVTVADTQPVDGYCIFIADPLVKDLNALSEPQRIQYALDCGRVGDALLKLTGAYRINYETWGNLDPALHTHIVPRFHSEPEDKRILPLCRAYDIADARKFDPHADKDFIEKMRAELSAHI